MYKFRFYTQVDKIEKENYRLVGLYPYYIGDTKGYFEKYNQIIPQKDKPFRYIVFKGGQLDNKCYARLGCPIQEEQGVGYHKKIDEKCVYDISCSIEDYQRITKRCGLYEHKDAIEFVAQERHIIVMKCYKEGISVEDEKLLYTNNIGRKSFQWELWQYCNSLCRFCYLGEENRVHNKNRQLVSLNDLSMAIDNLDYNVYNNISIIGGEFFQGQLNDQDIHDKFFEVIRKVFQKYLDKKIGSMWITATLTLGDQKHLYELLDIANEMGIKPIEKYGASGLWICTSWDAAGRFHNEQMKSNWEYHMKNMKEKYPWIKLNTTIILQQKLLEDYLEDKFVPKKFMQEFSTTLFYKQCGVPNAILDTTSALAYSNSWLKAKRELNEKFGIEFFPKRNTFIKFLTKYHKVDSDTFDRLFTIMLRADELHRNYNHCEHDTEQTRCKDHEGMEETNVEKLPCGHIYFYAPYNDCNKCCICDKEVIASE